MPKTINSNHIDADSSDDDDSGIAFVTMDFAGVNFDANNDNDEDYVTQVEDAILFNFDYIPKLKKEIEEEHIGTNKRWIQWTHLLYDGKYAAILREARIAPNLVFQNLTPTKEDLSEWISSQQRQQEHGSNIFFLEMEIIGIAALNLYMQLNYTGPTLEEASKRSHEQDDNYDTFVDIVHKHIPNSQDNFFHNSVLSQLVVDGEWPCQVCLVPYWLWISRTLLSYVAENTNSIPCQVWSLRAAVSHTRLLINSLPPPQSLWNEIRDGFMIVLTHYCEDLDPLKFDQSDRSDEENRRFEIAASLLLEWGLAQHYLDRPGKGRLSFLQAKLYSGLQVELTGSLGKRTKYQQTSLAQLKLEAKNVRNTVKKSGDEKKIDNVPVASDIRIQHPEDGILLEKIKYDGDKNENSLSVLDQCILMALCLDVKNTNPNSDVLTAEEMGAYLARVLNSLDYSVKDNSNKVWMLYATALLERSWLEFTSSHARERSLLQLQALLDQHTNRLSITQSTYDSVQKESSPAQERLRYLHQIVYPPRWHMIADIAERYAALGIVTSAAELFQEIEMWDQVVECYRRAGKETLAKQIVEQQLAIPNNETPRMWAALGDLTEDPQYYHKALDLSHGRFSSAWVALGKQAFDKGELNDAAEFYQKALALRPLASAVWFRLGTIGMQLKKWSLALEAFSQVVQQEPSEGDAWANVAAIHMHLKQPEQAYPALNESLKQNRNNWRVWHSKLYTCLDLAKYDEAILACHVLMDLRTSRNKDDVLPLEENCIRAIVGGIFKVKTSSCSENEAQKGNDESTRRSMTRVHDLLNRLSTQPPVEPWVFECQSLVSTQLSHQEDQILEQLLREYRTLQAVPGRWEDDRIQKLIGVVSQMSQFYLFFPANITTKTKLTKLTKCRLLVRGLISKIQKLDNYIEIDGIQKLEGILSQVQDSQNKIEELED